MKNDVYDIKSVWASWDFSTAALFDPALKKSFHKCNIISRENIFRDLHVPWKSFEKRQKIYDVF